MDKIKSETILEQFENNKNFQKLSLRRFTFFKMIEHLEKCKSGIIIETGTAWDRDNWEGQGQSTLIWDWVCERLSYSTFSIDLNPKASETAKEQTTKINFIIGDSINTLNSMEKEILSSCRLLYLDSFDWTPEGNLDSAFHHMCELTAVWRFLPSGCMIVVDDRHADVKGKHFMVEFFMEKLGINPVFKEYQIGWVKP